MKKDEIEAKRWLRKAREQAGLSQKTLAELVGVTRRTIINAESLEEDASWPHGFTLLLILRELGVLATAPDRSDSLLAQFAGEAETSRRAVLEAIERLTLGIGRIEQSLELREHPAQRAQHL